MDVTTSFENATIRVDYASKKGSMIDVVKMVLGCDFNEADTALRRLLSVIPDAEQAFPRRKINKKGRLTPVAHVEMLIEIVWLLPGKIADDIRRKMSDKVCRLLGGDMNLVPEIEARHIAMREASLLLHAREADQFDDMPTGFKFLSDEDREQLAKKMVEQFLKERDHDLQERSISLKRKRCDNMIYSYQSLEELGIKLDDHAKVHILDNMAVLTRQDVAIDGEVI